MSDTVNRDLVAVADEPSADLVVSMDARIAMLPAFYLHDAIRAGKVTVLFPRVATPRIWIHAVYPRQRHLSTKVRVFIDHIRAALCAAPWAQ